jgi:hypothetical protein
LALESVLSSIAPQQTNSVGKVIEGEGAWFRRALREADKIAPLASFVPTGTADPVLHLFNDLYIAMRSAMSHAKSGRPILLPQDEHERRAVTDSLRVLVAFFLRLAEKHLGARRPGGGMFAGGFKMMFGSALDQMKVHVSDDESPFDARDTLPNPGGGAMRELTTAAPIEAPRPFVLTKLWTTRSVDLHDLPFIRRAVSLHDGAPAMAAVLEGRLVLGSANRLEVKLGLRGSNSRQPRQRYSY